MPKLVFPVTLMAPNWAPPVTPNEVDVPTVKAKEFNWVPPTTLKPAVEVPVANEREPSWVPPETLNPPVEVALEKVELAADKDPKLDPPETVRPVVVALPLDMFPNVERPETFKVPPR